MMTICFKILVDTILDINLLTLVSVAFRFAKAAHFRGAKGDYGKVFTERSGSAYRAENYISLFIRIAQLSKWRMLPACDTPAIA